MERNYAIDYIKFFAILIVVSVHTGFLKGFYVTKLLDLHFFINTFSRFSVPFFFVVSGFLIGQKTYSQVNKLNYFKKYLWKTSKLFMTWTLFFFIYDFATRLFYFLIKGENSKFYNYLETFFKIDTLYYGPPATSHQLWYLTSLIWSVVILFIFIKFNKLNFLLAGSLLLNIVGVFGQSYSVILTIPIETRDALFYGLFYTSLGYFMATQFDWIKSNLFKLNAKIYLGLFFVFSITQIAERAFLLKYYGSGTGENYYFSTIPLIICLILFVLTSKNLGKNSFISKIGSTSVGIYVLHTFFISLAVNSLELFGYNYYFENLIFQLLYTPSVFVISYVSYRGIQVVKRKLNILIQSYKEDPAVEG